MISMKVDANMSSAISV